MSEKNDCPYCSIAKKQGELYCSRHTTDIKSPDSGIFFIEEKRFEECDWHITRLSLNFNFDDVQSYFIGNREHKVSPLKYLLINEGQAFKTFANSEIDNRMVTVAFKVGLAEEISQTLNSTDEYLLENSIKAGTPLLFFEQTYPLDAFFQTSVLSLIKGPNSNCEREYLYDQLEKILLHLLKAQNAIRSEALAIKSVRPSTRFEIYKRLHWALEYIHDRYQDDIGVEALASHACLSTFHFKRLFKDFFKESPYQYIKQLRIQKASELLLKGLPVNEVCESVGWKDSSSFIRTFKKITSRTPNQFRK